MLKVMLSARVSNCLLLQQANEPASHLAQCPEQEEVGSGEERQITYPAACLSSYRQGSF